ncbi:ribonuclease H [Ancylomarina sp. 16SWW S1-10-2]|uniref:ribonuclease H family protein n=1 Tax=Ancylomarina sp. 16SWW S1-10-2 TaxID=2499681 RepID=UPI0012AD8585|nr:ribonuclease H [Ancylomarina sp. 16SWW S1-10-2]MRT93649.1 ribonuclease HI [Ancylomarina sp. 16SWW S1-10-2]
MKPIKLTIQIEAINESNIYCFIFNEVGNIQLNFLISDGSITLNKESQLATIIYNNQHQFEKVIRSVIKGNIKVGQIINCVFIENFKFLKDNDFMKFIRVDTRSGKLDMTMSDSGSRDIHKIYADGSFVSETKKSGYGGFIEDPEGKQDIFYQSFDDGSSNLMELLAVTDGLQRLQSIQRLQINTDSRYVIRGLVQWCHFWKHNNWQTAYGRDVRYAKQWQQASSLCQNKFVEFKWIKGHSGNMKQDFCHQLAKEITTR